MVKCIYYTIINWKKKYKWEYIVKNIKINKNSILGGIISESHLLRHKANNFNMLYVKLSATHYPTHL